MAAVEQKSNQDGQLHYLQERVIEEAIQHAKVNHWIQTISTQRLLYMASFSLWMGIGFLFFLYQLITIQPVPSFTGQQVAREEQPSEVAGPQYSVTVEPGDIEVEKGSGLVVMARFEDGVPESVLLILGEGSYHELRLPMSRNLGDPIFGVRIPEITADTTYRIKFREGESDTFQITTYEHPALLVADHHDCAPTYTSPSTHDCLVVSECTITM